MKSLRQFGIFLNPYYWRTVVLIARCNVNKQYRNSFLGILWTLLQPLSIIMVYVFIMPKILRYPVEHYLLYIVSTLPLWNFISSAIIGSNSSLLSHSQTLKRCIVSSTVFPVAEVLRLAYIYCLAFGSMFLVAIVTGQPVSWHIALVPLYLLPVLGAVMAIATGIAFLAPYIRDLGELLTVTFILLFWFSAVAFPMSLLPENVKVILEWNPFYIMMQPVISLVYYHTIPSTFDTLRLLAVFVLATLSGYTLYRLCRHNFVYYL